MNTSPTIIDNSEQVARVLHQDWFVDDEVQINAFALANGETYLSVNRPAVDTFVKDVIDFVNKHPAYKISDTSDSCRLATMQVGKVRDLEVHFKEMTANLTIEVEPRDAHYKSHAGIFTRIEGNTIKGGQKGNITKEGRVVSYDDILLKVQFQLLALSTVKEQIING